MRILELGLGTKATSLIEAGIKPSDIAGILNSEERAAIKSAGKGAVTVRDVREFNDYLGTLEASEIAAVVKGSAEEKRLAARVQERISKTLDLMEKIERVANDVLEDFQTGVDDWRNGREEKLDNGVIRRVEYPVSQLNLLLKITDQGRQIVQTLHNDQGVRSFIRNATLTVNRNEGMSQRDLLIILKSMSKTLNIPFERVMSAFTDAQDGLSVRQGAIDVDSRAKS